MFQWSGGYISPAANSTLINYGTITYTGSGAGLAAYNFQNTPGAVLENDGSLITQGTGLFAIDDAMAVVNDAHGTIEIQGGTTIGGNHGTLGTLTSNGLIKKTVSAATATVATVFSNQGGTIQVDTGTLAMAAGGGTSTGGVFNVAQNATLDLTGGGSVSYSGAYTGSGAGTVSLSHGYLLVPSMGASFSFAPGMFQWSGGYISPAANSNSHQKYGIDHLHRLRCRSGRLQLPEHTGRAVLENDGSLITQGTGLFAIDDAMAVVNGLALRGTIEIPVGSTFGGNHGTTGTLTNNGSIDVESGTLVLAVAGVASTGGKFSVAQNAILDLTGERPM